MHLAGLDPLDRVYADIISLVNGNELRNQSLPLFLEEIGEGATTPAAGLGSILKNWHQALYMCILYDKWLEPLVWDVLEDIVKAMRKEESGQTD